MKLKYEYGVYEDAEDSWLLMKEVSKFITSRKTDSLKILDVGTGTGIQSINASSGGQVVALDVDFKACKLAKKNFKLNNIDVNIVCSDLLSALKGKFDLVIFNPPYLPEHEVKTEAERAICGGPTGVEVFVRFLEEVKDRLSSKGIVLFVYSSLEDVDTMMKRIAAFGFSFKKLSSQSFDFEELAIGQLTLGRGQSVKKQRAK